MSTIPATEVTEGQRVHYSVHAHPITVTRVRHNVRHYTQRVTFVHGTDAHGVLVELICDPEFKFVLPIED